MADSKISSLPSSTTPLAGTEVLPIVQSGTTKQVSVANLTSGRSVAASSFKVGGSGTGAIYSPTPINCGSGIFAIGAGSNSANGRGPGAGYSADSDGNINVYRAFWWQLGASDQAHLMLGNSTATGFNNPLTVTTDTNITFNTGNLIQGTAAKGINFTANTPAAGMTSQLLNWYEEGTWTPVVKGGSTAGTYQLQANRSAYTRIGKRVFIDCDIQLASSITGGGSGYFLVDGLPFSVSLNPIAGPVPVYHYGIAFTGDNTLAGTYTATTVLFGYYDAAGAQTIQDISAAAADGYIRFSLSYTV